MNGRRFLIGITAMAAIIAFVGCATGNGATRGMTPEEEIRGQLEKWQEAMKAQDVDGIMAFFSDNFEHFDWRDKDGARSFMQDAKDVGYLEGIDVSLAEADIKVDGAMGSVYPVDVTGNFGSLSMEIIVARENGVWRVTGLDAPGL